MPFRSVSFPIVLSRPSDPIILGSRMAVADVLRSEARAALNRATDSGVDAITLGQRMIMTYMSACGASRFLRAFPRTVAQWCFQSVQHEREFAADAYPPVPAMTVGGYGANWVTLMPHNNVLISAGGVRAAGMLGDGDVIVQHEIREVRLSRTLGNDGTMGWSCAVIMSSDTGRRESAEGPADSQPLVYEPEDT